MAIDPRALSHPMLLSVFYAISVLVTVYVRVYTHTCMYVRMYVGTNVCMYIYICICMQICVCLETTGSCEICPNPKPYTLNPKGLQAKGLELQHFVLKSPSRGQGVFEYGSLVIFDLALV